MACAACHRLRRVLHEARVVLGVFTEYGLAALKGFLHNGMAEAQVRILRFPAGLDLEILSFGTLHDDQRALDDLFAIELDFLQREAEDLSEALPDIVLPVKFLEEVEGVQRLVNTGEDCLASIGRFAHCNLVLNVSVNRERLGPS